MDAKINFKYFDPKEENRKITIFTVMQICMALVITIVAASANCISLVLSSFAQTRNGAQFVSEFSALLIIGIVGGLIPKGDYVIHTAAAELAYQGETHSKLRKLLHFGWLNALHDVFGLLPLLFVFLWSNLQVWRFWNFMVPAPAMIAINFLLAICGVILIPKTCELAHKEVSEQVKRLKAEFGTKSSSIS